MSNFIDIYCERTAEGLFNEPINAVTNIAFFIAAFFVYRLAKRENNLDRVIIWQVFLMLAIGVGSATFHVTANGWAQLSDILPILLFQVYFVYFYARRVIGWGETSSSMLLISFIFFMVIVSTLPNDILNGSIGYVPALLFIGWLGIYHWRYVERARFALLGAAGLFAVALTFRTMDMAVCDDLAIGTHFIWHILNGLVLYLSMYGLIMGTKKA